MGERQKKGIRLNPKFFKGEHKNISIILAAYMAIILFLFTYIFTKERNILDAVVLNRIKLEKSKTLDEKQQRQYLILIMFQQAGLTLILLVIPLSISLYQFSLLNKRSLNHIPFKYSKKLKNNPENFSKKLIRLYPLLTINDIKLCELIIQNISSKEIAVTLNISPASVNTARYRLRKKLRIPPEEDLLTFLYQI